MPVHSSPMHMPQKTRTQSDSRDRKKSTIDRARIVGARAARAFIQTASVAAPAFTDELLARRFLTPKRRRPIAHNEQHAAWLELRLDSPGGELAAYAIGESASPRVLLVHGWESRATDLRGLAESLALRGFRAVLVDLPAHGRSTGRRTNLPEIARAIRLVEQALGPFMGIVAHSLGAAAAVLALRDGVAMERAVLIAPPREPGWFVGRMLALLGIPSARLRGVLSRIERRVGVTTESLDVARAASTLTIPALIVHDRHDREVPFDHGVAIATVWPGARLVAVEHLGHNRLLRDAEVMATIAHFLHGSIVGAPATAHHVSLVPEATVAR